DDLRRFFDFMESEGVDCTVENVTTSLVRGWVVSMHRRGLSKGTVARRLYGLRSFWTYLHDCGHTDGDPVRQVSVPKYERKLPKYLPAEDLEKLLEASQQSPSVMCAFRNYAMMSVLIFTGMRRSELIGLKLSDVSLRDSTVRIRGKDDRERVVPLVDRAVDAVRDWLEFRPEDCEHEYLFTTTHGNRIYPSRMQRIWRSILERTDVKDEGISLHTLRHSMATLLLQSGEASLPEIQRILGHARLDTTAIYLHVTDGGLRGAVRAPPLAE
ncbi:MAG: tyrosine-type recombinase/integrase, partial [Armatimonadota bacterium]|nr:tyrosine-type recombinase/integrase [Armatimonadota bacterium]